MQYNGFPTCCISNTFKGLVCAQLSPLAPPLPSSHCLMLDLSAADPGAQVPLLFLVCSIEKHQNIAVKNMENQLHVGIESVEIHTDCLLCFVHYFLWC